jgi:cell division protein FtsZ
MNDAIQIVVAVAAVAIALFVAYRLLLLAPGRIRRLRRPEARAIRVIGVGGGGSNAVDRMVAARLPGVSFVACNTDAQALRRSTAETKVRIGESITRGLGSGGDPEVGRRSAEEDEARIVNIVAGADLVFITAGLGGGTGSGAAPIIGAHSRMQGALTIAVVTKPFAFEGTQRQRVADAALAELAANVDAIITIPNDRVADVVADDTTMLEAFRVVDDVLLQAVRGIIDLLSGAGLINLDFADVRAVMQGAGPAIIGLGLGSGENRALDAARQAISSPLLEANIQGARGILFNVSGPADLGLREVRAAADEIRASADPDANIIFGASLSRATGDDVLITLIATGLQLPAGTERTARAAQPKAVEAKPVEPKSVEPKAIQAETVEPKAVEPIVAEPIEPAIEPVEAGAAVNGGTKRQPKVDSKAGADTPVADSHVAPQPPASTGGRSKLAPIDEEIDEGVDLEVPSFLRRRR